MEIHNRLKNEVMKDYFTANVKAEVLIDTILTPVIDEILTFCEWEGFRQQSKAACKRISAACAESVFLQG